MDIKTFPIKVDREDARQHAMKKGGLLWRMIFAGQELSELRQHFVEYKVITFEAIQRPSLFQRLACRRMEPRRHRIRLLANGSTGSVAWIESMPEIILLHDIDENMVQPSDKSDGRLVRSSRRLALRIVHRFAGGIPELEVESIESIYRPFWIAIYGTSNNSRKKRYLPISADGCGSHRSF